MNNLLRKEVELQPTIPVVCKKYATKNAADESESDT